VANVDWALLKTQKQALAEVANHKKTSKKTREAFDGLLNFLDDLQDQAANQLGQSAVFGPDEVEIPAQAEPEENAGSRVYLKNGDMIEGDQVTLEYRNGKLFLHGLSDAYLAWWDEKTDLWQDLYWDDHDRLYYEKE
jgi:hypothetical protein